MKTRNFILVMSFAIFTGILRGNAQVNNNYFTSSVWAGDVFTTTSPPPASCFDNTGVGERCLQFLINGHQNSAFGRMSMNTSVNASNNSAFGYQSLSNFLSGDYNVAIGDNAGISLGNGNFNTFLGPKCGIGLGSGNSNTFVGGVFLPGSPSFSDTVIIATGGSATSNGGIQRVIIDSDGRTGIDVGNNSTLNNRLEINSGGLGHVAGTSGLRFRGYTNTIIPTQTENKFLTVNADGDVVLRNVSSTATGITNTCSAGVGNPTNYLVKNADPNGNLTCSQIFEAPGGAVGIGTQTPNSMLEINSYNPGLSGLQFTQVTFGDGNLGVSNGEVLSLDPTGVVIKNVDSSIFTMDGTLDTTTIPSNIPAVRTVTMGNNNLFFNTSGSNFVNGTQGSGRIYIGNSTNFPLLNSTAPNISQYRLLVEGGILSEKVKVALRNPGANWADYVFANDYKLMPLKDIESFVKENKHLPGIESACELLENGLDLGDMQAKQMAKIEELTLYAIEQEKRLDKQSKEIEELKVLVKTLLEKK